MIVIPLTLFELLILGFHALSSILHVILILVTWFGPRNTKK